MQSEVDVAQDDVQVGLWLAVGELALLEGVHHLDGEFVVRISQADQVDEVENPIRGVHGVVEDVVIELLLVSLDKHLNRRIFVIKVLIELRQILLGLIAKTREVLLLVDTAPVARLVPHFTPESIGLHRHSLSDCKIVFFIAAALIVWNRFIQFCVVALLVVEFHVFHYYFFFVGMSIIFIRDFSIYI